MRSGFFVLLGEFEVYALYNPPLFSHKFREEEGEKGGENEHKEEDSKRAKPTAGVGE